MTATLAETAEAIRRQTPGWKAAAAARDIPASCVCAWRWDAARARWARLPVCPCPWHTS